ncbi:extracellular solute-binding protein [Pseudoalteromonas fenneropenaei]
MRKLSPVLFLFSLILICNIMVGSAQAQQNISVAVGMENYDFTPFFAEFTKKTNITVDLLAFANNDLKSELLQQATQDGLPDVIIVPSDYMGLDFLNLSEVPATWLSTKLTPAVRHNSQVNGVYKGVPLLFGNHLLLYYNKKLLTNPPVAWQDFAALKQNIGTDTELIAWNYLEMFWFAAFHNTFGTPLIANGKANLNSPQMVATLKWYKQLRDQLNLDTDCNYTCVNQKFEGGKLAMVINGTWIFNRYGEALGDQLGVAVLPKYHEHPMSPFYSAHVMAFPNQGLTGAKSSALKKLVEFIQSQPLQKQVWQKLQSLPTLDSELNALDKTSQQHNNRNLHHMIKALESATAMPNDPEMAYIWEAMLKGVTRYLADVFDAEQAAQYMQYTAEKSIEHAKQPQP